MIGVTVVKLFDEVPYVGVITVFNKMTDDNEVDGCYTIEFEDGGELELEFEKLHVTEWKKLDRRQVLWLDEKHKKVHTLCPYSFILKPFTVKP